MKFQVGDNVEVVKSHRKFILGDILTVLEVDIHDEYLTYLLGNEDKQDWAIERNLRLVEPKKTKNQRITELEETAKHYRAELDRAFEVEKDLIKRIESLEFVLADKSKITMRERIEELAPLITLTPNQQRAEIIEKAKAFLEEAKVDLTFDRGRGYVVNVSICDVEFVTNEEKRTVVALLRWRLNQNIKAKGIAKCMTGDVFNEHIGKAIALGRALGLDVSEFEQAVQPTFEKGQLIEFTTFCDGLTTQQIINVEKDKLWFVHEDGEEYYVNTFRDLGTPKIINDTNAIYEETEVK